MSRLKRYGTIQKVVLVLSLASAAVVVTVPVFWVYEKIYLGVGMEVAQVTAVFQVFVLLVMTAVGVGLGHLVDWAIRQRRSIFRSPPEGGCAEILMRLWGYELTCREDGLESFLFESSKYPALEETFDLPNRPRRRGRKPTFPLEAWLPIAAKWENRDPIRDAFTLEDLIRESLGEHPDGSPIVSAQSYYNTWRERALEELHHRAMVRQVDRAKPIE